MGTGARLPPVRIETSGIDQIETFSAAANRSFIVAAVMRAILSIRH
jgi:hypothetical protein